MAKIFEKERLRASQLRTVAERRFDDADYLRKSGSNARANGVFYLGGFVIECLLKARLLEQYPNIGKVRDPSILAGQERVVWNLLYRSHELDAILSCLPDLQEKMLAAGTAEGADAFRKLNEICGEWTIFARYSPRAETMASAARFLAEVKELRSWLKH